LRWGGGHHLPPINHWGPPPLLPPDPTSPNPNPNPTPTHPTPTPTHPTLTKPKLQPQTPNPTHPTQNPKPQTQPTRPQTRTTTPPQPPRFALMSSTSYKELDPSVRAVLGQMHEEYFFRWAFGAHWARIRRGWVGKAELRSGCARVNAQQLSKVVASTKRIT